MGKGSGETEPLSEPGPLWDEGTEVWHHEAKSQPEIAPSSWVRGGGTLLLLS